MKKINLKDLHAHVMFLDIEGLADKAPPMAIADAFEYLDAKDIEDDLPEGEMLTLFDIATGLMEWNFRGLRSQAIATLMRLARTHPDLGKVEEPEDMGEPVETLD